MTMEENTRISRSSLLTSATDNEIFVAQILLDLPNIIGMSESGSGFKWGSKKRRSRLDDAPLSFQETAAEIDERQPQAKAAEEVAAAAASPVTPLAFPPSESDEKSRHAFKRSSRKRSREEYIDMVKELTERRDLLRQEIENVTNYYNKLIAHNSELKAMKQKVLSSCLIKEEPIKENSRDGNLELELAENQPQPLVADRKAEKFKQSIGPISMTAQFHSSYNGPRSVNHVGPTGIPDLNVSAEDAFGVDVGLSQPLDVSDRRARFAEARRRRMDIIKIKSMKSVKFPRTR